MKRLVLVLVACAVSGCGHLGVQVAVLDPNYVATARDQAALKQQLDAAVDQSTQDINALLNQVLGAHRAFYRALSESYINDAKKLSGNDKKDLTTIAKDLLEDFDKYITPHYAKTKQMLNSLNGEIRSAYAKLSSDEDKQSQLIQGHLAALLRQRSALIRQFQEFVSGDTADQVKAYVGATGSREGPQLRIAKATADNSAKEHFGVNLQGSPLAYAVAAAPENAWHALLNKAYARGRLGNFNVAIRLGGDQDVFGTDFTIKGLTFDPKDIATVASKSATQAVLLAAQMAGVPIQSSHQQTTGSGASLASSSGSLSTLEAKTAKRQALVQDYESALVQLANVILSERAAWQANDPAVRASAVKAIEDAYTANKSRLDLSDIQ